ncbi:MAG: transcriptional regulator [Candidatus Fonsibacter lacus]|nr:transcriptional regulator [Candidatus Fonsibacter lacus]
MKRSTLIQDLAIRYKYLNHAQVERMVELVFKHLSNALMQDQRIEIRGIGTWAVKDLKFRINSNTSPAEIDKKIEKMYDRKD